MRPQHYCRSSADPDLQYVKTDDNYYCNAKVDLKQRMVSDCNRHKFTTTAMAKVTGAASIMISSAGSAASSIWKLEKPGTVSSAVTEEEGCKTDKAVSSSLVQREKAPKNVTGLKCIKYHEAAKFRFDA